MDDRNFSMDLNHSEFWDSFFGNGDPVFNSEYFRHFLRVSEISATVAKIVIPTLLAIGVIGNVMVVFISTTTERIINHPIQSVLVVNLAVADTIYLLSSAPYQISAFTTSQWIYGSFLCSALHFLNLLTMSVSIFTICTMALIRLVSLIRPFEHHTGFFTHSKNLARILVLNLIWVTALGLSFPAGFFYRLVSIEFSVGSNFTGSLSPIENCQWSEDGFSYSAYIGSVLLFTYIAPCLLVSVVYFVIGRKLVGFMPKHNDSMQSQERTDYRNTTKLILILVIAFFICWLPYNLYLFLYKILKIDDINHGTAKLILDLVGHCFSYAHACINPIIYTFGLSSFQRNLRKTLSASLWVAKTRRWRFKGITQRRSSMSSLFHRRKKSGVEISATLLSPLSSAETPSEEKNSASKQQVQLLPCANQSNNNSGHVVVTSKPPCPMRNTFACHTV